MGSTKKKKKASKAKKSKSLKGLSRGAFTLNDKDMAILKGGKKGRKSKGGLRFIVPQ